MKYHLNTKNNLLFTIIFLLFTLDSLLCKFLINKFRVLVDDGDEIFTITEDDGSLFD